MVSCSLLLWPGLLHLLWWPGLLHLLLVLPSTPQARPSSVVFPSGMASKWVFGPPNGSLVLQKAHWSSKWVIGPPNESLVLQIGHWYSKWVIGPLNGSLVLQMGRWSSKWVIGPPNGQPYYWSSKRIIPCSLHGASYTTSYQPPCSLHTSFQQPSIHSAALIFSFMNQTYLGPW